MRPPNTAAGIQPSKTKLVSRSADDGWLVGEGPTSRCPCSRSSRYSKSGERRLTTGQISEAVLDDEDYIEVLKIGSFDVGALQEARVSAADAAAEAQVGAQLQMGPAPTWPNSNGATSARRCEGVAGAAGFVRVSSLPRGGCGHDALVR